MSRRDLARVADAWTLAAALGLIVAGLTYGRPDVLLAAFALAFAARPIRKRLARWARKGGKA